MQHCTVSELSESSRVSSVVSAPVTETAANEKGRAYINSFLSHISPSAALISISSCRHQRYCIVWWDFFLPSFYQDQILYKITKFYCLVTGVYGLSILLRCASVIGVPTVVVQLHDFAA